METVLISACLLGVRCRYDGASKPLPEIEALRQQYHLIPVCPEVFGGLPTPREPAERQGERVVTRSGQDVTDAYRRGAEETLRLAQLFGCRLAILKEKSPSCGSGERYDGTYSGTLTAGNGVTVDLLLQNGVAVLGESQIRISDGKIIETTGRWTDERL